MKALVWKGETDFVVEEVPAPKARSGRLVVKVEYAAVCGSDFHLADFGATPPLIPGHEAAGTVAEVGKNVKGFKTGARVALNPVQYCGKCYCCKNKIQHLCANYRHLGDGDIPGAWAEYVAIDAVNAHPVPSGVDLLSATLTEPVAVCYESFVRAGLKPKDAVLVIGDGPFGFLHAQVARAMSAKTIIVAGHYPKRLERIAAQTGAVTCNTHTEDLNGILAKHAPKHGLDVVVEATGAGGSPDIGIRALRPRGSLVIFSYIWKPQPLEMGLIHMKELNVYGACRSLNTFKPCLELMNKKKINTRLLADVIVPFGEYRTAMDTLKNQKERVFKAVFTPGQPVQA
jgi:threonine dehydrogenase-like Zn-dependent dehydrogenase